MRAPLIALVLLALVAGGYYFYQQSQAPSAPTTGTSAPEASALPQTDGSAALALFNDICIEGQENFALTAARATAAGWTVARHPRIIRGSMTPPFAAFSEAEHRERLARARRTLDAAGFDGCVSVAPEHLYYLAGYDAWVSVNSPQALVFQTDGGEPTLVLRDVDRPLATETSWVPDVRTYRLLAEDPAALIAAVAREHGLGQGRLAVELESYALPAALGHRLTRALANSGWRSGSATIGMRPAGRAPNIATSLGIVT